MPVTADSTLWTADTVCVTADGRVICIPADVVETAVAIDTFDAVVVAAGAVISVDVGETAAAVDSLDAVVYAAIEAVPGGAYYPRRKPPLPVYGVGFGILPQLWGEAHGIVGVAGKSAAQVRVGAAATGACGQAGDAAAVLKALAVAGKGAVGARGTGSGMIMKFIGSATGRHDDDEAAVIAFLLAA